MRKLLKYDQMGQFCRIEGPPGDTGRGGGGGGGGGVKNKKKGMVEILNRDSHCPYLLWRYRDSHGLYLLSGETTPLSCLLNPSKKVLHIQFGGQ